MRPPAQRAAAFALVLIQVAALVRMTGGWAVPIGALLLAAAGLASPLGLRVSRERKVIGALLLATAFAGAWRLAGYRFEGNVIFSSGEGIALAHFLLVFQALLFHLRTGPPPPGRAAALAREAGGRMSVAIPAYGACALSLAGDVYLRGNAWEHYRLLSLAFVAVAAAFFALSAPAMGASHASGRKVVAAVLVAGALALAWTGSSALAFFRPQLERVDVFLAQPYATLFGRSAVGYSNQGRLGSLLHRKTHNEDGTALRVFSEGSPGYLRGRAFVNYAGSEWDFGARPRPTLPLGSPPPGLPALPGQTQVYRLRPGEDGDWAAVEVWADSGLPAVFAPLEAVYVVVDAESIEIDDDGAAVSKGLSHYIAYRPRSERPVGPPPSDLARYTAVPPGLDPRVRRLADDICGDAASVPAKIAAVEAYFRTQYRYRLGILVPADQDPLTYFLLERVPAHCEYFASGAAVLLRLAGVPCRYVTGFVPTRRNAYGGYWVAYNRDAHAWVEAYDDALGWITVEATPAAGIPEVRRDADDGYWDYLKYRLSELRAAAWRDGVRGVARWAAARLAGLARSPWFYAILAVAAALSALRSIRQRRRHPKPRPDPVARLFLRSLRQMDRRMARRGLRRMPQETIHRFAGRVERQADSDGSLRAAAAWYRDYAESRYRGRGAPPEPR